MRVTSKALRAVLLRVTGLSSNAGRRPVGLLEQFKAGKGQEASPGTFYPHKGSEQPSVALCSSTARACRSEEGAPLPLPAAATADGVCFPGHISCSGVLMLVNRGFLPSLQPLFL